jgi:hypothetical protein
MKKASSIALISKIIVFGLLPFVLANCKLPRVIEKSEKLRPEWVYGISNDFVIVEGVGLTWDQAQDDALKKLKERIVSSVAVNISSETNMQVSEQTIDNMSKYSENTEVITNISTDFFNSLKGISLSKSTAFYWEKMLYPEKQKMVHYHIKYPFSQKELNELISEWEKTDKGFTAELDALEEKIQNSVSIAEMQELLDKTKALKEIFGGTRKSRVALFETEINQHLSSLKFEVQKQTRGQIVIKLLSSDRYFKMTSDLVFESSCASLQDKKLIEDGFGLEINYDADFCYSEEKATISVKQNDEELEILGTWDIPDGENQVRLTINEPVRFKSSAINSSSTKWNIPIRVFTDKAFTVTKVEMVVSHDSKINIRQFIGGEDKETYLVKDINQEFKGKGDYSLQFEVPQASSTMLNQLLTLIINESSTFSAGGKIYIKPENEEKEYVFQFEGKKLIRMD